MKIKKSLGTLLLFALCLDAGAIDNRGITFSQLASDRFTLVENGTPNAILIDEQEDTGVMIAAKNLQNDFERVTGKAADLLFEPGVKRVVIVGTLKSRYIKELVKAKKIDASLLNGKNEKYLMTVVPAPLKGMEEALVIAGSDKRGTIYGIYELSEQIGVSPWYDWADVPVVPQQNLSIVRGSYTAGEPAVKYRGIFLNDEAPCLTGWVKHTYGTNYGDHRFYARVFELILRLRGNFMWPAMWGWSFYADDPENSKTANDMGVIMGTSHHEPMARNHQEWARKRKEYGAWDYASNQKVIDRFFREGIERAVDTEDLITIGMRGDGDTPMGGKEGEDDKYVSRDKENMRLMEKIFKNQRRIIKEVTGKAPEKRPQVWALYKEVQRFYDMGLRVPDDVIMLLSDDNWGNVRRLPNAEERKHPGGWGIYYHVDYVGAPRNAKWLNVTPIQNMWEQLQLTYDYGVDKLWVLNVGDLKPMEYPITLFLDMAWNPKRYAVDNLLDHPRQFCAQQFGEEQAMNHKLYKENNPQANYWADKVEQSFKRDKDLCDDYNNVMSGGKWKNMMIQKHIGYTSWNDNFPADKQPEVYRIEEPEKAMGGYVFKSRDGVVAMEAEHYFEKKDVVGAQWTVIPYMGRTLSGMALMPYTKDVAGASLSYKMEIPKGVTEVTVHIVVKSTLAFHDIKGHKYEVGFNGGNVETINFNANLNEEPENVYTTLYPTVARRVVESQVKLELPISQDGLQTLTLKPLDPGIVFEKIVVDFGGYRKTFLFMNESPCQRDK